MIDFDDPQLHERMLASDSCYWAEQHKIKLMGNTTFTLENCSYMKDIMLDTTRHIAVMKGAQARITTCFMLKSIHSLRYGIYTKGVIYYFPSRDAVEDFSKTRFTPLIQDNPCIRKYLKSTNSVFAKRVGKSFLTLKGATATMNLKGRKKDSMAVRSTPADEVIRDERDLFDDVMVEMTTDRLLDSKFKREVDLGTPTMPDFGMAQVFGMSDQKHRMIRCDACNSYTCLEIEFPNCIKHKRETTHTNYHPYFACIECGKEINPFVGEFVAKYPERRISGYSIPHLITPNCKLSLVMDKWDECQADESKMGTFYNSRLGMPFIHAEDRLVESAVIACCGNDAMRTDISIGATAMGVDIGKHYHTIVIAEKVDAKRCKLVYLVRVKGFNAIHDIARKHNVKSAVIDRRPYEEEFENFQKSEPYRVFGAEYKDKQRNFMKTDEESGTYSLLRTQIFDRSHALIKNKFIELPRQCEEVNEFARQMCNCAKILEETEQGDRIYRYIKLGDDHYRSAINYLIIALENLHDYEYRPVMAGAASEPEYDVLRAGLD